MTRRSVRIFVICASLAAASGALAQSQYGFQLVTHDATPAQALTREAVSDLFLATAPRWDDDTAAIPVHQAPEALLRDLFSWLVHERPAAEIGHLLRQRAVESEIPPPLQLTSDQKVLDYVRAHPGAVGYVSADTELGPAAAFANACAAYPTAFCSLWHHPSTGTWVGATPERLLRARGGAIDGEAEA